jgi:hypothetical protein
LKYYEETLYLRICTAKGEVANNSENPVEVKLPRLFSDHNVIDIYHETPYQLTKTLTLALFGFAMYQDR